MTSERPRAKNPKEPRILLDIKPKRVLEAGAQSSVLALCRSLEKQLLQSPQVRSSEMNEHGVIANRGSDIYRVLRKPNKG